MQICKICGLAAKPRRLFQHYRLDHTNTSTSSLPCFFEDCSVTFRNLSSLATHISRKHRLYTSNEERGICRTFVDEKLVQCVTCDAVVKGRAALLSHLRSHLKGHLKVSRPFGEVSYSRVMWKASVHLHTWSIISYLKRLWMNSII